MPPKWHWACNPLTAQISALQAPCLHSRSQHTRSRWPTPQSSTNQSCPMPLPMHALTTTGTLVAPHQQSIYLWGHLLCRMETLLLNAPCNQHTHTPTAASAHHAVVLWIIIMHIIMLCVEIHTSSVLWNRGNVNSYSHPEKASSCLMHQHHLWYMINDKWSHHLWCPAQEMHQRSCRVESDRAPLHLACHALFLQLELLLTGQCRRQRHSTSVLWTKQNSATGRLFLIYLELCAIVYYSPSTILKHHVCFKPSM